MTAHDHDAAVAAFGECPVCAAAALSAPPAPPTPDGVDVRPEDVARLGEQARRVVAVVADGSWRTLAEIAERTGDPEASISARLRDLRKDEWGAWTVNRRRRAGGTWEYQALPPRVTGTVA